MTTLMPSVGFVVIGRNEGARLRPCLESLQLLGLPVVYADSASTDGSCELAASLGATVVAVEGSGACTAARGRNAGLARLLEIEPGLKYVQFVDGDCTVEAGWVEYAVKTLENSNQVGAVRGALREKGRETSIYGRLLDMEWQRPSGEVLSCGGIAMMRVSAFREVGGFDATVAAGEENEFCRRLRGAGHQVMMLEDLMAVHDSGITTFRQWWVRASRIRPFFMKARAAPLPSSRDGDVRALLSILFWSAIVPIITLAGAWPSHGLSLVVFALYPLFWMRILRRRCRAGANASDARLYAAFCILSKFAQFWGLIRYLFFSNPKLSQTIATCSLQETGRQKSASHERVAAESPDHTGRALRVAYLNTQYPSLSHTFIEREVRALRGCGVQVHTFSIRRPSSNDMLSKIHEQAARDTCYILTRRWALVLTCLWQALGHPLRFLRVNVAAQKLSLPGIKSRLLHIMYALEGMSLARHMRCRHLKHVHVHMANNGAAVALLATAYDKSLDYSLSIHGSAEFFQVQHWRLRPKVEGATFVRCISKFCKAQIMAWSDASIWNRFHIVHCGVDLQEYQPKPRMPLEGPLRILTVGRMESIKGYPLLLEACRMLSDRGFDWRLEMVGDGSLKPFLEEQAKELGITDRVDFCGAVGQDRIQEHFDRADVMVISSFMEGVPVVLMEAMAKQLAVVATRVGGIPELITDGIHGRLVTPGSAEDLANALAALAEDRNLMASLTPAARRRIRDEFSVAQLGLQMRDLFSVYCAAPICKQSGRPPAPPQLKGDERLSSQPPVEAAVPLETRA